MYTHTFCIKIWITYFMLLQMGVLPNNNSKHTRKAINSINKRGSTALNHFKYTFYLSKKNAENQVRVLYYVFHKLYINIVLEIIIKKIKCEHHKD